MEVDLTRGRQCYLQRCPVADLLSELERLAAAQGLQHTSVPYQEAMVTQMFAHSTAVTYPPGATYTKQVLHRFVTALDDARLEVADALLAQLISAIAASKLQDADTLHEATCYESYEQPHGSTVTCRVAPR
jgi:hypothetical protein